MCGIVGYVGAKNAETILLESLRRLEYRGYDSAGIATIFASQNKHKTEIRRAAGKLSNLFALVEKNPCPGQIGIGHTRWATHGKPTENNAHPHYSETIALVHNGIIENHFDLREMLIHKGQKLYSETDTEIIAHLIADEKKPNKSLLAATIAAIAKVKGAFAVANIDETESDTIICVKHACPLIIGLGKNENYIASDYSALLPYTNKFIILEDGDFATVKKDEVLVYNHKSKLQKRSIITIDWTSSSAQKEGYPHFMLKEIHEQPIAITDTLRGRLAFKKPEIILDDVNIAKLKNIQKICIVACGTSYHASMIAKHFIEDLAQVPVEIDLASEFRYRSILVDSKTLVIGISQSGETADTLAALKQAKKHGALLLGICNVIESSIPRLCNKSAGTLYKAFITQIAALHLLALALAKQRKKITESQLLEHMNALLTLPTAIEAVLKLDLEIKQIADHFANASDMLFLGRGYLYPIALEGALKMKELSYVHAEGYAAGEMKHGAIALIDNNMPIVILAPQNHVYEKVASNLEEAKSRGGQIIGFLEKNDEKLKPRCEFSIEMPQVSNLILAAVWTVPMQLLAYYLSNAKGLDVDQPRNLAKSVTVE